MANIQEIQSSLLQLLQEEISEMEGDNFVAGYHPEHSGDPTHQIEIPYLIMQIDDLDSEAFCALTSLQVETESTVYVTGKPGKHPPGCSGHGR